MAYKNCDNCNSRISCSCQYQVASNGTQCCDDCIDAYEASITIIEEKKLTEQNDTISDRIIEEDDDEETKIL